MSIQKQTTTNNRPGCFAVIAAVLIVIVSGCSTGGPEISEDLQASFRDLVPIGEMNKSFTIRAAPSGKRSFASGSDIDVEIQNQSDTPIYFPLGYGIKLYIARDNKWIEVKNGFEYIGNGFVLLPQGVEPGDGNTAWISPLLGPDLQDGNDRTILRIVVAGEKMFDGKRSGVPVGAYTDVFINP